jgi:hypothetical protein
MNSRVQRDSHEGSSLIRCCRAASWRLANEAVLTGTGHTQHIRWSCRRQVDCVVLVGRATHVPEGAGNSGIQRTVTVNPTGPLSWLSAPDPGDPTFEKLHGMQEVRDSIPQLHQGFNPKEALLRPFLGGPRARPGVAQD